MGFNHTQSLFTYEYDTYEYVKLIMCRMSCLKVVIVNYAFQVNILVIINSLFVFNSSFLINEYSYMN